MASISSYKDGVRRIQFFDGTKSRRSIRLGKMSLERAEEIAAKVDALNADAIAGQPWKHETARWVAKQCADLYAKLANVDLVPKRDAAGHKTLEAFIDVYIAGRSDLKPSTLEKLRDVRVKLVDYFGAARRLEAITPGEVDEFRRYLRTEKPTGKGLAENSARSICKKAKQLFVAAQRKRLIVDSPFADMKGMNVQQNDSRLFHVTDELSIKVLAACIDDEWRLLFALARYGGLRCPSEVLRLRWCDIDLPARRFTVHSPKTEHHEGKEWRVVPLFPELVPYLKAVENTVLPGINAPLTDPVIRRYRSAKVNLRTELDRAIRRAGLNPWPKRFQNLRSTRETELVDQGFPEHVVCAWLGNSPKIARKHYLQVTDAHFEAASGAPTAPNAVHPPVARRSKVGTAWHDARENVEDFDSSRKTRRSKAPRIGRIYELWRESAKS